MSCRKENSSFGFKLKQDFLQTGRNILPIKILNDCSNDTYKVIQLSKSYLCFTTFSFINILSGRNDFPHGIFANTCFCYYSSCPKSWLISTFNLFLKILCDIIIFCSSTLIDFPLFRLEDKKQACLGHIL